ncbi:GvpL/GvpF family gas vesicle protein [Streptomyces sp. ACA25]|uniref:GvpL/GvpF family gas vesicle protein n=1 Tax=Streptomyces sp. ACA25 TaxID=3022596 RepID=UPI0023079BFA|nr:GvpL/GvpF family gas vesicle protein [Streptomyces sp. ACA25]MDB1088199.1 GvpL/GvpF family gas vesicle protein [Streptomyces sp. ACA25]
MTTPPQAEEAVTYVFAVCRRRVSLDLGAVTGHGEHAPVRTVTAGALTAVVQEVPAADHSAEALQQRLGDRAELERCARAHHEVVAAVAACVPAVPLPLATIYLNEDRARRAVAADARRFLTALDRIEGRVEWGVKVYSANRPAPVAPREPARRTVPDSGAGHAYLERVRGRHQARESRQEASWKSAERVDTALRDIAVAGRRLRAHAPAEGSGGHWRQVLNAAYLVCARREHELTARIEELRNCPEFRAGMHIEVTGPWVPYSFVDGGETDDHA